MSCPKWAAFSHAWYWSKGKGATYHNDILVASIHSCKQQPIYCIVCIRVCLIPYIWFLIRILDFGKCNPYGTAKGGERFAKDLRKGGSWELLFSTTPIYTYIYHGSFGRVLTNFQHDIRTFWFSLMMMTPLGVFIESTSCLGLTSLSFSSWLGDVPWGLPCVQEIHSRRTCLEHSDSPVFSVSLPMFGRWPKLARGCVEVGFVDPILPTDSNGIYHENGEFPWLCSFTGG